MNSAISTRPHSRVICYVDGFNLYFGLRERGFRRYYWLNVGKFAAGLLRANQALACTKYFTARISGAMPSDLPVRAARLNAKRKRQADFLEALETVAGLTIFEGHYLSKPATCLKCGAQWRAHEEKMTDVNIATELLVDAFQDRFDTALIISADSDLVPPVKAVLRNFPAKRVVVAFPLGRSSNDLKQAATAWFSIHEGKYKYSQFADQVTKANGHVLQRPTEWQ